MRKRITLVIFLFSLLFLTHTLFSQVPNAPSNLNIQFFFSSALSLSWSDNSINESGFYLDRSTDGINFSRIQIISPNTNSFCDIGLSKNIRYYYRVSSFNASGTSGYSNVISGIPESYFDCNSGSDTISCAYPFYTTYTDSRTQMLYLKSEMIGICNVGTIWNLAFYSKSPSTNITNITIKMKNTTDTVVNKFIDSGLSTVLNNQSVSVYSNGWFFVYFPTPFTRDVNKNLLVEICFHHTTSAASNVILRSTAAPNKVWHNHKNLSNGCTLDSGSVQSLRPNIKLATVIDGVKKISENVPSKFSIEQNYPNPFNGDTKFKFSIKEPSPVTLSLYDILGRQEVVVFSEPLSPGEYEKIFSLSEHQLPSGIYYYCFVANGYVSVKKMVVLK